MIAHGFTHSPSDWLLAITLLLGSAFGSQVGVKFSYRITRPYLGILGAIVILLICSKFGYDFHYLGLKNPIIAGKKNISDVFDAAILTTPDWALWMVKLAYNHPLVSAVLSIVGVTGIALLIEHFICRFIVVKR